MADILFEQIVWAQEREDEIKQANERFRRTLAYCSKKHIVSIVSF